jgi:hypothetical protein
LGAIGSARGGGGVGEDGGAIVVASLMTRCLSASGVDAMCVVGGVLVGILDVTLSMLKA